MGNEAFVRLRPLIGVPAVEAEASFDALASGLRGAAFGCTIRPTMTR